jgi:Asp-tRNA(Asn)/Glu-tRNA(Gln) amidotransferase A subunit family amidase
LPHHLGQPRCGKDTDVAAGNAVVVERLLAAGAVIYGKDQRAAVP